MTHVLKRFERVVTTILILMMAVVVVLSVVELGWVLVRDVISHPVLLLEIDELVELFGLFLLVLIGLELVESIKAYGREGVVRVEIAILVAMLAIGRKVIILDLNDVPSVSLLGVASIIVALALAYHALRRARGPDVEPRE